MAEGEAEPDGGDDRYALGAQPATLDVGAMHADQRGDRDAQQAAEGLGLPANGVQGPVQAEVVVPDQPVGEPEAGTILVVAPASLLHPRVPQPDGSLVYELLTGHPEREAGELVFVADLTGELRAWPHDTWAKLGIDPDQVTQASSAAGGTAKSLGCRSTT